MITEQPGKDELPSWTGVEKKYAGNPWTSGPTIIILVIIPVITLFLFFYQPHESPLAYLIGASGYMIFFYLGGSLQMNYFIIREHTLVIKNHYNRDELTSIPFEEIASLELISAPRVGICLTLNHINGNIEIYQAQSLCKKHWRAFRDDMMAEGIIFTDDRKLLKKGFW